MDTMGQPVGGGPIGVSYCHHFGGSQVCYTVCLFVVILSTDTMGQSGML